MTSRRLWIPSAVAVVPFLVLMYLLGELLWVHQPGLLQSLHEWGVFPQDIDTKYRLLGFASIVLIVALLRFEQKWIKDQKQKHSAMTENQ